MSQPARGFGQTQDAAEGAEALGSIRVGQLARTAFKTARKSRGGMARTTRLASQSVRIAAGRSSLEPARRDWRFADPTWQQNPIYRRVMQLYLAWCREMDDLAAGADIGWRDAERAKFMMEILTSAAAPTNTLLGNPAALKRTFETGGANLLRGARHQRMRGLAQLVAELIARLGHERVDVLGYSFGGVVAQELARRHPERVRRLVLCATVPGWPTIPGDPVAWSLMLTPARYYNRQLAELIVPRIAGGRTARDPQVRRANLRRRLSHPPSLRGYTHQLYALSGWTSHPWLDRLSLPTMVIQGDADPLVATANARWLAWRIPEAELHLVEGAGHLLLMDEAARVAPIIDAFLRR